MTRVGRRAVLIGGAVAVGAAAGVVSVGAIRGSTAPTPPSLPTERFTYEQWQSQRSVPYFIGHRGAGDVVPEHTLPGYQTARAWGAEAIEISVVRSADNQVYCLHDLTLTRTTTGSGRADVQSAASLAEVRVDVPRLGPRWSGANMPPLPLLRDVLAAVGGRMVLCIESKDDSAYPLMIKEIEDAGLTDTVMVKLPGSAVKRLEQAKAAGFPVYAYLGDERATRTGIAKLARLLDPGTDALALPSRSGPDLFSDRLVRQAVKTGIPVWVVPVHRRYEVEHFTRLGVSGMVTPDLGYLTGAQPTARADSWATGGISPGELTLDPTSEAYGLHWLGEGSIGLDGPDRPAFVSLGQFCPLDASSYRVSFDAAFDPLPREPWQHLSIAFGHVDDRYYEHRCGLISGYHAKLCSDGSMGIYAHRRGNPTGLPLSEVRPSTRLAPGNWARLTLDVTPDLIRWTRDDGTTVETHDSRFRGGYFHIGRSGTDGMLRLRNLVID